MGSSSVYKCTLGCSDHPNNRPQTLTNSGAVSVSEALNPTILNIIMLEKIEVKEFVRQTVTVFARVLYRGLV